MSSELWICSKDFLKTFHNERGWEVQESFINSFSEKIQNKWGGRFRLKMMHGYYFGSALRIYFKFCIIRGQELHLHNERGKEVHEKFFFRRNGPFWAQKLDAVITVDPPWWFSKKFCAMIRVKRCTKIILMIFLKKLFFRAGQMGHFEPRNDPWS